MFKNLFSAAFKTGGTIATYVRTAKIVLAILAALFIGGTVFAGVNYVKGLQTKNTELTLKVADQEKEIADLKQTAEQNKASGKVDTEVVAEVKDNHATAEADKAQVIETRDEKVAAVKKKYNLPAREQAAVKHPEEEEARVQQAHEISAIQVGAMWDAYCKLTGTTVAEDCLKDTQDNRPVEKAKIVTGLDVPGYLQMDVRERAEALNDLYESTLHYIEDEAHA